LKAVLQLVLGKVLAKYCPQKPSIRKYLKALKCLIVFQPNCLRNGEDVADTGHSCVVE